MSFKFRNSKHKFVQISCDCVDVREFARGSVFVCACAFCVLGCDSKGIGVCVCVCLCVCARVVRVCVSLSLCHSNLSTNNMHTHSLRRDCVFASF